MSVPDARSSSNLPLSKHSGSECICWMGNFANAYQRNTGSICAVYSNSRLFGAADNQPVGSSPGQQFNVIGVGTKCTGSSIYGFVKIDMIDDKFD